jgi:TRAP-type C4-dicarboxylate transport system permease small subunit
MNSVSLKSISNLFTAVTKRLTIVAAALAGLVMIIGVTDIISSKVFNSPIMGLTESTEELMVAINLLTYAYITITRQNISVNIFENHLSASLRWAIRILTNILGIVAVAGVSWGALSLLQVNIREHIGKPYLANIFYFPLWPGSLVLFVGACLWCIAFILLLIRDSIDVLRKKPIA